MSLLLLVEVHLLHGRWHGAPEWPPSPFRLFQALVAGAYSGRWASEPQDGQTAALEWLEGLPAPRIVVPAQMETGPFDVFVPNNDLDAVDGDQRRVGEIRAKKVMRPRLMEADGEPFVYAWEIGEATEAAAAVCDLADRLHTFGWGLDPAFAHATVVTPDAWAQRLEQHGGCLHRPVAGVGRNTLPCPISGSLASLRRRHEATGRRFALQPGRGGKTLFRQPPKALSRPVAYDVVATRLTFDLRPASDLDRFRPIPQAMATPLVEALRDAAAARLSRASSDLQPLAERFLIGRGATAQDLDRRVRILALPSIGMAHTSPAIRRVVIEIPPDCPLRARELAWAFAGVSVEAPSAGKAAVEGDPADRTTALVTADDGTMLRHYGIDTTPRRRWQTITPAALPIQAGRRRSGDERATTDAAVAGALATALRHAGIEARPTDMRIQREPFRARGLPAESFVAPRFAGRLRHIEITFDRPVSGPLIIGDGRFLGLGLMAPAAELPPHCWVFSVASGSIPSERTEPLLRAVRRAIMARVRDVRGGADLPAIVSAHEGDGRPLRPGNHAHLFYAAWSAAGGGIDRVAVLAPQLADRSALTPRAADLRDLGRALEGLATVRAGTDGLIALAPRHSAEDGDPMARAKVWRSGTPYRPTRHPKAADRDVAIVADLMVECRRRKLPLPVVEVLEVQEGPRGGLAAKVQLTFPREVRGPILLGRGSHFGAGLFQPVGDAE